MIAQVLAVLAFGAAMPLSHAGAAKASRTDAQLAKQACLQQDPQLKGKALRTCMKAKRAK